MADLIRKGGNTACEDVIFALLEGDPMYIDVFIVTMTNTPFIGPEDKAKEKLLLFHEYRDARTQLTPDQDDVAYGRTLKTGPMFILQELGKLKMGAALFAAMQKSKVYPLLIHRFMRLIGREGLGNEDGIELGPICRDLLPKLCKGTIPAQMVEVLEKGPMPPDNALKVLDHAAEFDSVENFPGAFKNTVASMSHGAKVSKYLSMLNRKK